MNALHLVALVVALAASAHAKATKVQQGRLTQAYDCSNQADGQYTHPTNCNAFISCSNGIAHEMDCHTCDYDAVRCPDLKGVYNETVNQCLWADETTCGGGSNPTDPPEESTEDPGTPAPGEPCDERCNTTGYCQHYDRCEGGVIVRDQCVDGLFWNPLDSNGDAHPHGGNCDHYDDISREVLDRYHEDPDCLECKLEEDGDCNNQYLFRAYGATSTHISTLTCGSGLVFSNDKQTCVTCAQYGGDCCDKLGN